MAATAQVAELEFSLLRTFLSVVDHGSIGRAAAAADITQPAVSQQMLRLERIVGQKLFERGRNGITLTRHGEMLVTYANRAVELTEEALTRLREAPASEEIVLAVTAESSLAGLIPGMERLRSIFPELQLKVAVTPVDRIEKLLRTGEADLAITPCERLKMKPTLTWDLPLFWATRKGFEVSRSRPLSLVLLEDAGTWQEQMLSSLQNSGWDVRVAFRSTSLDAILTATQSGLGVAALPADVIRKSKLLGLDCGLPPAPIIQFGMFAGVVTTNHVRTAIEVAEASLKQL